MIFNVIRNKGDWEKALLIAEYDFNHTWDYISAFSVEDGFEPVLFKLELSSEILLMPLIERSIGGSEYYDLVSAYGYGGAIFSKNTRSHVLLYTSLLDKLSQLNYVSLFTNNHPLLPFSDYSGESASEVVFASLSSGYDCILKNMRKVHRRDIKNSINKGMTVSISTSIPDLDNFKSIYEKTMKNLNAGGFYFFSDEFYLKLINTSEFETRIWTVMYEGKSISSALIIRCGDYSQYFLSGTDPEFYNLYPNKLLLASSMERLCDEGCKYFLLGGGVSGSRDGLFDFKYGFTRKTSKLYQCKEILNAQEYERLSSDWKSKNNINLNNHYFPQYRA